VLLDSIRKLFTRRVLSHIFFAFARARRMEAVPLHRSEQYNGTAPRDLATITRSLEIGLAQTAHFGFIVHPPAYALK
jgi:hypothetical protein